MFGQGIFCPLFYDRGIIGGFSFVRKIVFLSFFQNIVLASNRKSFFISESWI